MHCFSSCQEVLRLADVIYLVSTAEVMSLHLARRRINQLMQLNIPIERIKLVVNRVGSKRGLEMGDIGKVVGVPVEWTISNDYGIVNEAYLKGGLVPQTSGLGKELSDFACHIMGIQAKKQEGKRWKIHVALSVGSLTHFASPRELGSRRFHRRDHASIFLRPIRGSRRVHVAGIVARVLFTAR